VVLNVNYLGDEVSRASSEDYASISHFPEEVLNSLILIAEWLCNNDKVQQQIFLHFVPVLGIRIRRILMFLGLPDPDPLVRGTDPAPAPSLFL
jgi:hypothetical protein